MNYMYCMSSDVETAAHAGHCPINLVNVKLNCWQKITNSITFSPFRNMLATVFLISLYYGAPLVQLASYLALHSSLIGPLAQLIMIILSLTALTLVNWLKMYSQ